MKLIRCHVENFGKLHDFTYEFTAGCNVICRENGWGKSTLADFIRVMFYGFSNEKSRDDLKNERKRYQPWGQGGNYGGSLEFETEGRHYEITRVFGLREKEDRFELRNRDTNLKSDDFSASIGEELFQLDCDSFCRTVFISQNDCETAATGGINAKLGNLSEDGTDIGGYERAMKRLTDLLNQMSPERKTGRLFQMSEEMARLREQVRSGEQIPETIKQQEALQNQQLGKKKQLEEEQDRLNRERNELQAYREQTLLREQYDSLKTDWMRKKAKYDKEKACFPGPLPRQPDLEQSVKDSRKLSSLEERLSCRRQTWAVLKKGAAVTGGISLLLLLAGTVLLIVRAGPGILGAVLTGLGLFLGIVALCLFLFGKKALLGTLLEDCLSLGGNLKTYLDSLRITPQEDLQSQFLDLSEHLKNLRYFQGEFEEAKERIDEFERRHPVEQLLEDPVPKPPGDMKKLEEALSRLAEQIRHTDRRLREYEESLEQLQEQAAQAAEDMERLEALEEDLEKEQRRYGLLKRTKAYLAAAKTSFTARYTEPLLKGFQKYYALAASQSPKEFYLDADTRLTVLEQGMQRETRFFSTGYRDLMGVCLRLALIDAMYETNRPFVILDDPFSNLDDEKLKGAMNFLKKLGEHDQILYFTCHQSRS